MTQAHQAVLDEARRIGFPFVHHSGSMHLAGEEQYTRNVPTLPIAALREIEPQLAAHAEQARRDAESTTRESERDAAAARRLVPLDPNDPNDPYTAQARQMAEDAARAHAESQLPATRQQASDMLSVLERIAAAVEGKRA